MSTNVINSTSTTKAPRGSSPAANIARSLLGYGVIAGPLYLIVALAQILTREGFDPTRHSWSQLTNGGPGWIQVTNLMVAGLMTIAGAVGLRRALGTGQGATWSVRLIGVYGASLVAAGAFRADPGAGFPVGTPEGTGIVSWHGMVHLGVGAVGFTCLAIGLFVLARHYAREGHRRGATALRIAGAVVAAGFAAVATGGGSSVSILAFTIAVVVTCLTISAVSAHRYRTVTD